MAERKATRHERLVLGTLFLGLSLVGVAAVSSIANNINGRHVPPDPLFAAVAGVLAAAALVATFVMATRFFGGMAGLRFVARELWPGLLAGGAVGGGIGMFLHGVVAGIVAWLLLLVVCIVAVAVIYGFAMRGAEVGPLEGHPWDENYGPPRV